MGGIMFIVGIIVSSLIILFLYHLKINKNYEVLYDYAVIFKIFSGLFMALCFGAVGFIDDYIKVIKKRNLGLKANVKLFFQFMIVTIYLASIYFAKKSCGETPPTSFDLPLVGPLDFGFLYWVICAVMIVGIVNAVNLTDGIDGLNASVTFVNSVTLCTISLMNFMPEIGIISACLAGACLGFLCWNFHPAKVFMGDTGAMFLGGILCAIVFGLERPLLLIPIGMVYLIEMFSVILQVIYFKITKGKRLFKMSPIHHHFEMCGWNEKKICLVFSLAAILGGVVAIYL
jgi:phospho-N-acetylmuramoyl-pentapeptide-transferase